MRDGRCTILPNGRQFLRLFFSLLQILLDLSPPLNAEYISLRLQTLQLDFHPDNIPIERLKFVRFRFLGKSEGGGRFVHEVDRLVGEVPVGYVPTTVHGRYGQKNPVRLGSRNQINEGSVEGDGSVFGSDLVPQPIRVCLAGQRGGVGAVVRRRLICRFSPP